MAEKEESLRRKMGWLFDIMPPTEMSAQQLFDLKNAETQISQLFQLLIDAPCPIPNHNADEIYTIATDEVKNIGNLPTLVYVARDIMCDWAQYENSTSDWIVTTWLPLFLELVPNFGLFRQHKLMESLDGQYYPTGVTFLEQMCIRKPFLVPVLVSSLSPADCQSDCYHKLFHEISRRIFLLRDVKLAQHVIQIYSSEDLTWTHQYPPLPPWSIFQWVADWGYNSLMDPSLLQVKNQVIDTIVADDILTSEITNHLPNCVAKLIKTFLRVTAGQTPTQSNLQPPNNLESMQVYWRKALEIDVKERSRETRLKLHRESVERFQIQQTLHKRKREET